MHKINRLLKITICLLIFSVCSLYAATIKEKKEQLQSELNGIPLELFEKLKKESCDIEKIRQELKALQLEAKQLFMEKASAQTFQAILQKMNEKRAFLAQKEACWNDLTSKATEEELSALWHLPKTTLFDLVTDFGSSYLYIIPDDIASTKLTLSSNIHIPSVSWDDILENLLTASGFGTKQINPFVKVVFPLKESLHYVTSVTNQVEDLGLFDDNTTVLLLFTPKKEMELPAYQFFSKFLNPSKGQFSLIGSTLFLVGKAKELQELLRMFQLFEDSREKKEFKLITLSKLTINEACKILQTYFTSELDSKNTKPTELSNLSPQIIPLTHSQSTLFILGTKEELQIAEKLIEQIEFQAFDPKEKQLFCYQAKHVKPDELVKTLDQLYNSWIDPQNRGGSAIQSKDGTNFYVPLIKTSEASHEGTTQRAPFVIDSKCGSIVMIVEKEKLSLIKDLLKKLDVPKKMVQIEVLLFEKKITQEDHFGLNLLKIGGAASSLNKNAIHWNDAAQSSSSGILSFFLSRSSTSSIPAFDLAYNFLLSQDNVEINACPSVTTLNQTPAKIALVEEISVNNGAVLVEEKANSVLKDSYSRAQYGITIEITPTVHEEDLIENHFERFITLEADITFDTTKPSKDSRPEVTRRNVKNQVRVLDGQTVVIGGLRRKMHHDAKDLLPFLGELPAIGKLFSESKLSSSQTEMFIFLTPKVINDTKEDLQKATQKELEKRPGDLPELLQCLEEGKQNLQKKLFSRTINLLVDGEH